MPKIVGIDLGTTNSLVAIVENGVPRVLPGPDGSTLVQDDASTVSAFLNAGRGNGHIGAAVHSDAHIEGVVVSVLAILGTRGVPPRYGSGAEQIVASTHKNPLSKSAWITDLVGAGDIDRVIIEWRSLLRQIRDRHQKQINRQHHRFGHLHC